MKHTKNSIKYKRNYKTESWFRNGSNKENAIAFCHYYEHKGYLSEGLLKQHCCVAKNCKYLQKYENKCYWIKKKVVNAIKKYNKNNHKGFIAINDKLFNTNDIKKLLDECMNIVRKTGNAPDIRYMSVCR